MWEIEQSYTHKGRKMYKKRAKLQAVKGGLKLLCNVLMRTNTYLVAKESSETNNTSKLNLDMKKRMIVELHVIIDEILFKTRQII